MFLPKRSQKVARKFGIVAHLWLPRWLWKSLCMCHRHLCVITTDFNTMIHTNVQKKIVELIVSGWWSCKWLPCFSYLFTLHLVSKLASKPESLIPPFHKGTFYYLNYLTPWSKTASPPSSPPSPPHTHTPLSSPLPPTSPQKRGGLSWLLATSLGISSFRKTRRIFGKGV